jgi:hypothetical protein
MPEVARADAPFPRGIQHITFFGLFFIYFAAFALPFWYLMRDVLPRSVSLANESSWFSPEIVYGTHIHYVGLSVPLVISVISIVALYLRYAKGSPKIPVGLKALVVLLPISFLISQYTVLGIFVSVGLTDPILLVAFAIYEYNVTLHRSRVQAALTAYPVGFFLGFISDLESVKYFGGVFGGWGLGDGDFIYPLSFLVGSLILALTWRPIFSQIRRAEAWVESKIKGRVQLPQNS